MGSSIDECSMLKLVGITMGCWGGGGVVSNIPRKCKAAEHDGKTTLPSHMKEPKP